MITFVWSVVGVNSTNMIKVLDSRRFLFCVKALSHSWHWKFFSWLWIVLMCIFNCLLWANSFLHTEQGNVFFSWTLSIYILKPELKKKLHYKCGRSCKWAPFTWSPRFCFVLKSLLHDWHGKILVCFSSVWTDLICFARFPFSPNFLCITQITSKRFFSFHEQQR